MKNYTKHVLLSAVLACSALAACNSISEDERFIDLPAVNAQRVVLLEDYTGQKCSNCPDGHKVIEALEASYPDNFIAVSIHGGGDAWSYSEENTRYNGLRNDEGQAYSEINQISSFPTAIVNRTSGALTTYTSWSGKVIEEMEKPSHIDIALKAEINADSTEISITTVLTPYENIQGALQLWVLENDIIGRQTTSTGIESKYVHQNVFRGTVNGMEGEAIALLPRTEETFTHTIGVKELWTAKNLSIVAFVYDSKGVQQAARAYICK